MTGWKRFNFLGAKKPPDEWHRAAVVLTGLTQASGLGSSVEG